MGEAVGELIKRKFGIRLSVSTVGRYLRRWGFTPQKPLKKAYEQNPKEVKRWVAEEYPQIQKEAKEKGAEKRYFLAKPVQYASNVTY